MEFPLWGRLLVGRRLMCRLGDAGFFRRLRLSFDEIERIRQLEGSLGTTAGEVARLVADTEHNAIAFIGDELALMGFEDSRGFLFAPFRSHDEVRPTRVTRVIQ